LGTFFSLGQVLPTHRKLYSEYGGPFQPTVPQAIRLLSSPENFLKGTASPSSSSSSDGEAAAASASDPFTHAGLTYSTTGSDCWRAPSAYGLANRNAWVHVFPEGCIHQHEALTLRYFKWGVSRLILEAEPAPDVLPICIDGTQHMMSEERTFPRFLPRGGHTLRIVFGDPVDAERAFGDLRARWRDLVRREADKAAKLKQQPVRPLGMGELTDELKYGDEAVKLRIEVAKRIRDQIEHLRMGLGYPADDPKLALAETWAKEPAEKAFKSNVDNSLVRKE
jgi:monolysocardiolipin acyltransferase